MEDDEQPEDTTGVQDQVIKDIDTEKLSSNQEYRSWLSIARGNVAVLALLDKFCSFSDEEEAADDGEFEDDDFEDMEDDGDQAKGKESNPDKVIDLDKLKTFGWDFIQRKVSANTNQSYLDLILEQATAIPRLIKLPHAVYELIDDLLENAFRCLASLLHSCPDEMKQCVATYRTTGDKQVNM